MGVINATSKATRYAEKAQLYEDAIVQILSSPNESYTVMGQSFTKHDIEKLERLQQYYERRAQTATYGCKTVADLRRNTETTS